MLDNLSNCLICAPEEKNSGAHIRQSPRLSSKCDDHFFNSSFNDDSSTFSTHNGKVGWPVNSSFHELSLSAYAIPTTTCCNRCSNEINPWLYAPYTVLHHTLNTLTNTFRYNNTRRANFCFPVFALFFATFLAVLVLKKTWNLQIADFPEDATPRRLLFFQFSTTIFNTWRCSIFMQDMKVKKAQDF